MIISKSKEAGFYLLSKVSSAELTVACRTCWLSKSIRIISCSRDHSWERWLLSTSRSDIRLSREVISAVEAEGTSFFSFSHIDSTFDSSTFRVSLREKKLSIKVAK